MMLPHWFIRLLKFGARTINHLGAERRDKLRCEYWFEAIDHMTATEPSQCAPWEIWWHMAILRLIDWWIGVLRCSLIMFLMTKLHYLLVYWFKKGVYCSLSPKLGALVTRRRQHICSGLDTVSLLPMDSLMQYWFGWKEINNSLAIFYYLRNRFGDSFCGVLIMKHCTQANHTGLSIRKKVQNLYSGNWFYRCKIHWQPIDWWVIGIDKLLSKRLLIKSFPPCQDQCCFLVIIVLILCYSCLMCGSIEHLLST